MQVPKLTFLVRGGSIVADLLASNNSLLRKQHIHAAVRSKEQTDTLVKLGINVLQLDLTDEEAVVKSLVERNSMYRRCPILMFSTKRTFWLTAVSCYDLVTIVIHCASSMDPSLASPLVSALAKQREISGEETYFIHVSKIDPSQWRPTECSADQTNARQTSGLSAFYERTGWPKGEIKDTDPVFDTEKQLADSFPIRQVSTHRAHHHY